MCCSAFLVSINITSLITRPWPNLYHLNDMSCLRQIPDSIRYLSILGIQNQYQYSEKNRVLSQQLILVKEDSLVIMSETRKNKILVVDDDPDITTSFHLALEDTGLFEVETYNDSVEALSNFKPYLYDFILLDIKMPKMSGFELCDKI